MLLDRARRRLRSNASKCRTCHLTIKAPRPSGKSSEGSSSSSRDNASWSRSAASWKNTTPPCPRQRFLWRNKRLAAATAPRLTTDTILAVLLLLHPSLLMPSPALCARSAPRLPPLHLGSDHRSLRSKARPLCATRPQASSVCLLGTTSPALRCSAIPMA